MKHVFIINPAAGEGKYQKVVSWVERNFSENDFSIHITKYPGHAKEIAAMYEKDTVLYSVGGDGTAFEVVNGMNFENELAVIPVGTGNDFVKMVPYKGDIIQLLEDTVFKGHVEKIDIGQANEHLFLNEANIGLDARVVASADKFRGKTMVPRTMIYLAAAIKEVFRMEPVKLDIYNDDFKRHKNVSLLAIMNGQYYGSAFRSAPQAKINDGLLDLVIVDEISRVKAFSLIPKYMKGKHEGLDIVEFLKVKDVTIENKEGMIYVCDGEIFTAHKIDIKIHPGKLKYRFPKGVES
ncbi:MAG TPA: diacylglycerol kinase family protein [Erysipelothrix sp.]|nr:diacylglycerol kinase family protein [Erysipelothrix sp.]